MLDWFSNVHNIWMIPVYPLIASLMIILGRAFSANGTQGLFANKHVSMILVVSATALGLLHTVFGALPWLLEQPAHHVVPLEQNWAWLQAGNFTLSMGYLLDSMSVMMLFVVTFISLFIQIYTHGYMDHDPGYNKFYAYLALFNFSMLGLVLSTNLFQIYVFWELVGVCSYLLIGFWFTKKDAAEASLKAFLMNRVGDFGLLIGILSFLFFSYQWWMANPGTALLSFSALTLDAGPVQYALSHAGLATMAVIAVLIFMGPMAKSAQVPLHTWLPDAMAGPTPISALIHAATMVAAGVYLVGRAYPIFITSETAMAVVVVVGVLTAVVGATIALTQYDIKKALAYSTMSQLGFMVAAMGVGAFTAGLFHLFTHAFFKALLFLCSGSVIHACENEQDMRKMGGLLGKLPVTGWTYLIGTVAIAGLPMTSGFFSKDMILEGALEYHTAVYWTLALTAGLTAFYMFRTFFLTFTGKYRGDAHVHHESPWMTMPLAVLAVPALIVGYLLSGFAGEGFPAFGEYIVAKGVHLAHHPESLMALLTGNIAITSSSFAVVGALLAYVFYGVNPALPEKIRTSVLGAPLYQVFSRKWYFDDMYQAFLDRVYMVFANGSAQFDRGFIDGIVNGSGRFVMNSGYALRQLQSGRLQTYVAVLFFGVVTLALFMYYLSL